jgi:O-antigen biosynthesis protein
MSSHHLKESQAASTEPGAVSARNENPAKETAQDLVWDGERYIPGMSVAIELEHMHRYILARKFGAGLRVLDIACGEGYGSNALADVAGSVVGVDISEEAVSHARAQYGSRANLEYKVGSAADIPLDDASVDMVVSFETIEHHDQHEAMMREIKRVLKPGGIVVISSPNKYEYSDVTGYANPWHVKELYLEEFDSLLREQFAHVEMYGQRVVSGSLLAPLADQPSALHTLPREEDGAEQAGVARPLYFVAVASDAPVPALGSSVYEAEPGMTGDLGKIQEGRIECKVYWHVVSEETWSEKHAMACYVLADGSVQQVRLEIHSSDAHEREGDVCGIRLDLGDRPCVVRIDAMDLVTNDGPVAWSWDGLPQSLPEVYGSYFLASVQKPTLVVTSDDPWLRLPVPAEVLARAKAGWAVRLKLVVDGSEGAVGDLLQGTDWHLSELAHEIGVDLPDGESNRWAVGERAKNALTDLREQVANAQAQVAQAQGHVAQAQAQVAQAQVAQAQFEQLEEQLRARERALAGRDGEMAERDSKIAELSERVIAFDREREVLFGERSRLTAELLQRDAQAQAATEQFNAMLSSTSWRITRPLRFARRLASGGEQRQAALRSATKVIYRRLPVPGKLKRRVKGACFRFFPGLFSHTRAYQDWAALRAHLRAVASGDASGQLDSQPITQVEPQLKADETNLASQVLPVTAISPAPEYQAFPPVPPREVPVRTLAFYLPQFHPFAENDEWWGRGFTEWTNVTRAVPQFAGHYQPHLPGELGFYDLRVPDVQRRQVELAKAAGLGGFVFYFYWFGGKRLMETPIRQYLEHKEFDLPFCLCWANENWSRRWDGLDQELLISQHHSPEDDIAFIEHVAQYMHDPRYIRVGGRPFLLVYRPGLLPDAKATVKRWRDWARANGLGEIYLAYTQSFEKVDPRDYGFDAAVEFPPNNSNPPSKAGDVTLLNREFSGHVLDWTHYLERSRRYETPSYRLYRGVTPSWDNEARKPGRGTAFVGSSPDLYQEWLYIAAVDTVRRIEAPDERLVFVNAWNEWAEGAHLEPDRKYGYAWLQATNNALTRANAAASGQRVVVVSHDAYAHGAQYLALNLVRTLASDFGVEVTTVLLGEGPLKEQFAQWSEVHDLAGVDPEGPQAQELAQKLMQQGYRAAICNSTVSGLFAGTLARGGLRCVSLVHELPGMLVKYGLERHAEEIGKHASAVVFPAAAVRDAFEQYAPIPAERVHMRPQGLYKRNQFRGDRERARSALREKLHLPKHAKIVLGVGYADRRKGVDLFIDIGEKLMAKHPDAHFVWVGHWEGQMQKEVEARLGPNPSRAFIFPGIQADTDMYYAGADVFALTSREDPFPSVVLEALEVGVPVVAFEGATGAGDLLSRQCGVMVPFEDPEAFASATQRLLDYPEEAHHLGDTGARIVAEEFSFRHYLFDLLDMLGCGFKRVSVVVPNYNYARYIEDRLNSILKQKYPIYELIVLDDCSTDGSVEVIKANLANQPVYNRLIVNETNSGSVFAQWRRGADLARGDYVWIAEADDLAKPELLSSVMAGFKDDATVLSYCESKQMAESGEILCDHYRDYVADISKSKWDESYTNTGEDEIRGALAVKNTIPNVSAVVFRRAELANVLHNHFDEVRRFRVAGDWMVYLRMMEHGKVAFAHESLNLHRRHGSSVTIGGFGEAQLKEIRSIQLWVRERFDVPRSVTVVADAYANQLCTQFGLDRHLLDEVTAASV